MTTTPPAAATTRVAQTVDAVRADIIRGTLAPGSKLVVESMRQHYGVGSSTIREALSLLQPDGLVRVEGQKGFSVAPMSIDDIEDISRTRAALEVMALRASLELGDDEWEANVVAAWHRMGKAQDALDGAAPNARAEWEARNEELHAALTSACGSYWTLHMLKMLYHHSERYRHLAMRFGDPDRDVRSEHEQLVTAALERDIELACRVLESHILHTADAVREVLTHADIAGELSA